MEPKVAPLKPQLPTTQHSSPAFSGRFPIDVIVHIVKLAQCADAEDVAEESTSHPVELTISQVSSFLRRIALNSPLLWTSIRIVPHQSLSLLPLYLQRSAACSLDLRVNVPGCAGDRVNHYITQTFAAVTSQSFRWRKFFLNVACVALGNVMLKALHHTTIPLVEQLSLCVGNLSCRTTISSSTPWHLIKTDGAAPLLTFLRLRGLALHLILPPLTNITTLHIDQTENLPIECNAFFHLLTAPTSLQNLSLYGDIVNGGLRLDIHSPIQLPFLVSLRMCSIIGASDAAFLLGIIAPALKSLVLQDVQPHDLDQFFLQATSTTFPGLESLSFHDFDFTDLTYYKVFDIFPRIKSFTVLNSARTPSILKHLTSTGVILWPALETLTTLVGETDISRIHDMVQYRFAVGYPLKTLRLGGAPEDHPTAIGLDLLPELSLEWFFETDRWPPNRRFSDIDDVLFL